MSPYDGDKPTDDETSVEESGNDASVIKDMLKGMCPFLRMLAGATKNPHDDRIVNSICSLVDE